MAPGQTRGANQSGYLWGSLYEYPRYEYARDSRGNPEVVVSDVRTPPELETGYLTTNMTRDPRVTYLGANEKALGPSWGMSDYMGPAGPLAGRQRRNTAGDISFRSDLVEARGGFSLADAQAVQRQLGLKPTVPEELGLDPGRALERAIETIRSKEGLASHAEVVDTYARRLPRMGRTTNPRSPADVRVSEFSLDTRPGITSSLRKAYDIAGALREANMPPTREGYTQTWSNAAEVAAKRVQGIRRVQAAAPAAGIAASLADPEAAKLLGMAVRESNPRVQRGLAADALRVYGQNAVVGGIQGAAISGAIEGVKRLGMGGVAAAAVPALAVAGPALTGMAAVSAADNYLQAATGEGLKAKTQRVQRKVSPQAAQAIPQLLPSARAVVARTPSGVARLTKPRSVNPVAQEALNRAALFRQRFNPLRGEFGLSELLLGR